jgi:hypothetical protein
MGVRPNSPPQTISVSSSMPRCFEIGNQCGSGTIAVPRADVHELRQVVVMVPIAVIELNEPYAPLG